MLKRILQVNINNEGGAFSLVYQIQKKISKEKYAFDYFTMGEFNHNVIYDDLLKQGSYIYESGLRSNRMIGHLFLPALFYRFVSNNEYSIIHIHSDSAWKALMYALPAQKAGVKNIIIHSHSTGINGKMKLLKRFLHEITKQSLKKNSSSFVACSTEAAEWMFGKDIENVKIIKNGVDLTKFKTDKSIRNSIRKSLCYNPDDIVIGTIGDFSETKNPKLLIDIYETILKINKKSKLLFVGDGNNKDSVKKLVFKKNLQNSVRFMGKIENVQEVLNAMDAFVLPSIFEGLPVSAVEAQATGVPTFLSPNITREAGIEGLSWYNQDYWNVDQWANLIMNNIFKTSHLNATEIVKKAGFDIVDTVDSFEKLYGE